MNTTESYKMTPELEAELSKHLSPKCWKEFHAQCVSNGLALNEDCLEYGSVFVTAKYWFSLGWDIAGGDKND